MHSRRFLDTGVQPSKRLRRWRRDHEGKEHGYVERAGPRSGIRDREGGTGIGAFDDGIGSRPPLLLRVRPEPNTTDFRCL